ncbi:SxtJ family membrane protein [Azospirillum sp.]|uniref:SxtJ family membrane protein n=1 Tax=Azospirillum sp. TaxID=34012 RepID=UPI00262D2BB8|nr:SxtJ family membrane protein [Azospirillum sp.]
MSAKQLHEDLSRGDDEVQGSSDRGFGFVFAGFFGIIGALKLWRGSGGFEWWLIAAISVLLLALAAPGLLAPFNRLWMKFGLLLHRVMNPVVMGLMFYVGVVPIGLLMRALGKRSLNLAFDPQAVSYWVIRQPPGPAPNSIRRQF